MGLILTILLGAFVGWVGSIIMNRDREQGWILNILVGIAGAFIGGLFAGLVGGRSALELDAVSLFFALLGACALLAVVNYLQRGTVR